MDPQNESPQRARDKSQGCNVESMFDHRLRRWLNIDSTYLVFVGR